MRASACRVCVTVSAGCSKKSSPSRGCTVPARVQGWDSTLHRSARSAAWSYNITVHTTHSCTPFILAQSYHHVAIPPIVWRPS
jgi:hypothetical protein